MSPKFSGSASRPPLVRAPITTVAPVAGVPRPRTFEGGGAFSRDAKSDLFLLAVTNMVGEDTFYESAGKRDDRFRTLIRQVVSEDLMWVARFIPFLRTEMNMRSAAVVMACEYVAAGGPNGRTVIDSACARADEPAEVVGYWTSTYGRNLPMPVKRGVADAVVRLYHERSALRYDGQSRTWRMGDVIELTHPKAKDAKQNALFKYLLDVRHRGEGNPRVADDSFAMLLPVLVAHESLTTTPEALRRDLLRRRGPSVLADAGLSWEALSGWLPGGMDAEAWEAIIPSMGVMALLRNLRNFDKAGISEATIDAVIAKVTDPEEVAKSRIFPFRVWAAYREAPSDNWKRALGKTLDLTTANVPKLDNTLVVVDCSGSMTATVSGKSTMARYEVAAVTGAALWKGTTGTDVVVFGAGNKKLDVARGSSALAMVERVSKAVQTNEVGSWTNGHTAIRDHWDANRHQRVVLITDDQMSDSMEGPNRGYSYGGGAADISHVAPIFTVNLAGYSAASLEAGTSGRFTLGGFSDAAFRVVDMLGRKDVGWPF